MYVKYAEVARITLAHDTMVSGGELVISTDVLVVSFWTSCVSHRTAFAIIQLGMMMQLQKCCFIEESWEHYSQKQCHEDILK